MHPRKRLQKPAPILTSIFLNFICFLFPLAPHIRGGAISSSSHRKTDKKNCQQYNSHPSQAESVRSKDKNTLHLSILPDSATTQSTFPTRIKIAYTNSAHKAQHFPRRKTASVGLFQFIWGGCEAASWFRTPMASFGLPQRYAKVCGMISRTGKEGGTRRDQEGPGGKGIKVGVLSFKSAYIAPSSFNFAIIPSTSATLPPPCRGGGSMRFIQQLAFHVCVCVCV